MSHFRYVGALVCIYRRPQAAKRWHNNLYSHRKKLLTWRHETGIFRHASVTALAPKDTSQVTCLAAGFFVSTHRTKAPKGAFFYV